MCSLDIQPGRVCACLWPYPPFHSFPLRSSPPHSAPLRSLLLFRFPDEGHTAIGDYDDVDDHDDRHNDVVRSGGSHFVGRQAQTN